jgi:hypothetical protein
MEYSKLFRQELVRHGLIGQPRFTTTLSDPWSRVSIKDWNTVCKLIRLEFGGH